MERRTAFSDFLSLFTFIIVICGGDFSIMTKTCSKLTWVEEWIFYFEYMNGKSLGRLIDYEMAYKLKIQYLQRVFRTKLDLVLAARKRWPMYLSYKEDIKLRNEWWNTQFPEDKKYRIIMHDNTNIKLPTATDADQERSLYSDYYKQCCAKGGVSIQSSSWISNLHLVTGGVDDTRYIDETKILKQQRIFQEGDEVDEEVVPFVNIFDKGYRVGLEANKEKQSCLQPIFAKCDQQFNRDELLHSASVAVLRSGNERGVNLAKNSKILGHGIPNSAFDLVVLDNMWLAWGFQINFMYNPIH